MRTVVLAAGILLVVMLVVILALSKGKSLFNRRDLPTRLGLEIQQQANGVTYTQSHGGHTLFKIHASRVVQLKQGTATLHDVKIEIYGQDGSRVDRIEGGEFEYDQKNNTATAAGPVEITLMRPAVAPAIAPKATAALAVNGKAIARPLATAAETAASGEIHVKTSGLTFDQKSGVASTSQHVDFSSIEGRGSSMGATYDSQQGYLILDHAVEMTTARGGDMVNIHAQRAAFARDDMTCSLRDAIADYRGGRANAAEAKILFRDDGSAVRLDTTGGFALATATGGNLNAPVGSLDFDEHNQPRHGHLEGGVKMDSVSADRLVHGTSPTAELEFTPQGELRHAHLERGVEMHSEEVSRPAAGSKAGPVRLSRTWNSPVADVDFREAGHGQVEPATIHGTGGVVVTGLSQRGQQAPVPSRLSANEVTGTFAPDSVLSAMTGVGNAGIEETTATGDRQFASGDRLEAHFAPAGPSGAKTSAAPGESAAAQLQSAELDGHVSLMQQPAARPPAQAQAPMRATAGRAVYEGSGSWLHLTLNPRVDDGGLQLAADKIDISQDSGDAFAHGNVKATWFDSGSTRSAANQTAQHGSSAAGSGSLGLGGQGPAHVIASEAQLHQATGEATFRGHARLWQEANSVAGPLIVLDRQKQTLVAKSTDAAEPVRAVLLSAGAASSGSDAGRDAHGKAATPAVIRLRGGDLKYSDAEHKAVMSGGALGRVVADTGTATSQSSEVELILLPPGNHAAKDGGAGQVDRMTAKGAVTLTSEGRRGTGEQLVYTGANEEYVLTGTAAAPPRMTDPARGTVTGAALIFRSRDDSVSIEGGGRKTTTDTTAPK
jgi:lipopolysaccharide export system protein LptA